MREFMRSLDVENTTVYAIRQGEKGFVLYPGDETFDFRGAADSKYMPILPQTQTINAMFAVMPTAHGIAYGVEGDPNVSLPWRCSQDLHWFREMTRECGGTLIMGRKTAQTLFKRQPAGLDGRTLIVVSSGGALPSPVPGAIRTVATPSEAVNLAGVLGRHVFVVGGPKLIDEIQRINGPYDNVLLTHIDASCTVPTMGKILTFKPSAELQKVLKNAELQNRTKEDTIRSLSVLPGTKLPQFGDYGAEPMELTYGQEDTVVTATARISAMQNEVAVKIPSWSRRNDTASFSIAENEARIVKRITDDLYAIKGFGEVATETSPDGYYVRITHSMTKEAAVSVVKDVLDTFGLHVMVQP